MFVKKAVLFCLCFAVVFSFGAVFVSSTIYDFGGMYSPQFSNPATGTYNCPTGYYDGYAYHSGPDGYIYANHHFCYKEHVDGYDGYFDFGGAYNRDGYGDDQFNPVTSGRWCPTGYSTGNLDYINYCYRYSTGSGAEYSLGGFYSGGSPPITNPITNYTTSCPPDYAVSTVLSGTGQLEFSGYDVSTVFFSAGQYVSMNMCLMEVEDEVDCSGLTFVPFDGVCVNVDPGDSLGCNAYCGALGINPGEPNYTCDAPDGYCTGSIKCIPGTCNTPAEICNNYVDDDGDGDTDCADSDCVGETGPGGNDCCANDADCFSVTPGRCMTFTCDIDSTNECEEKVNVGITCIPTVAETGEASDEDIACSIFTCDTISVGVGACVHTDSEPVGTELAPCSGELAGDICNKMACDGLGTCVSTPYPNLSEDDSRCVGEYPAELCYKKVCDGAGDCVKTPYDAKSTEDTRCTDDGTGSAGNFVPAENICKYNACSGPLPIPDGSPGVDVTCLPFRKIGGIWPTGISGKPYKIVSRTSSTGCAADEGGSNPLATSTHGAAFWGNPQALGLGGATSTSCCAYPKCPGEDYSVTTFLGGQRGIIKYSCIPTGAYAGIKALGGLWALTAYATERCENNGTPGNMCAYNTTFVRRYPPRVPNLPDTRLPPTGGGGGVGGNYCQGQACVFMLTPAPGAKQCSSNEQCVVNTHTECNGSNQCVSVGGEGPNQCIDNIDCLNLGGMHTVCNGLTCQNVADITGEEDNGCSIDADCGANQGPVADATVGVLPEGTSNDCFGAEYFSSSAVANYFETVFLQGDRDGDDADCVASYDPDGETLSSEWTCIQANSTEPSFVCPTILYSDTDFAQFDTGTIIGNVDGTLIFELTVTDILGVTDSDQVTVTVSPMTEGAGDFRILLFTADPISVDPNNKKFSSVDVKVENKGSDNGIAIVVLSVRNAITNEPLLGGLPLATSNGQINKNGNRAFSFSNVDLSGLPNGTFRLVAEVFRTGESIPDDTATKQFTIGGVSPVPELSLLFLPLMLAVVLFVVFRQRHNFEKKV